MRLKNVKGAKDKIESSCYVIQNPSEYKGNFKKVFGNDNPIYIELGMGKGTFIINNALIHSNINFIGIEKFDSVLVRAIEKLEGKTINNLKLIRLDANDIENIFEKEISNLFLNFSDPWPKDRHAKRRLTSPVLLNKYDKIFKDKKSIVMKTDNRKLFEYSLISLTDYGYKIKELSLDLHKDNMEENIQTEYEMKFSGLGFPIYRIDARN